MVACGAGEVVGATLSISTFFTFDFRSIAGMSKLVVGGVWDISTVLVGSIGAGFKPER